MVKSGLAFIAIALVVGWTAPGAAAATCDDYSTQADAQRAADTRDADGDGLYCEDLPCPCLRPGQSSAPPAPRPTPRPAPRPVHGLDRRPGRSPSRSRSRASRAGRRACTATPSSSPVIDGDTIDVELDAGEAVRVRLLGVDTPETHKPGTPVECGGFEATANMLRLSFTRPRDD